MNSVELAENKRKREEDAVVKEGLRDDQGKAQNSAPEVLPEHDAGQLSEADRTPWPDGDPAFRLRQCTHGRIFLDLAFQFVHNPLGFLGMAVGQKPARALGNMPAQDDDHQPERGTQAERQPPAQIDRQESPIKQDHAGERAGGRPQPERAVDRQVGPSPHPRGNQLVDRRVDGRVFAADRRSGQEPEEGEADEVPRDRRQERGDKVESQCYCEQLLAAEPVGQVTENQCSEDRSSQVGRPEQTDFRAAEMQALRLLKHGADRPHHGHFQTVDDPGDAQGDDYHPVPSAPGQAVEPGRHVAPEGRTCFLIDDRHDPACSSVELKMLARPVRTLASTARAQILGISRVVSRPMPDRNGCDHEFTDELCQQRRLFFNSGRKP